MRSRRHRNCRPVSLRFGLLEKMVVPLGTSSHAAVPLLQHCDVHCVGQEWPDIQHGTTYMRLFQEADPRGIYLG